MLSISGRRTRSVTIALSATVGSTVALAQLGIIERTVGFVAAVGSVDVLGSGGLRLLLCALARLALWRLFAIGLLAIAILAIG